MNELVHSIITWLEHLQICMPPSHITLVGAGNGKGAWAQWLQNQPIPSTLVEADAQQFAALRRLQSSGSLKDSTLIHKVVAAQQGATEFFTANLIAESGLLSPENLHHLWPNLHTVQAKPVQTIALAQLFQADQAHQWLMLDCLPAAALLQKAQALLPKLDVVLARVVLTKGNQQAEKLEGTSLAELAQTLPDFLQLALQPSRHPEIAYVLFVRDYRRAWQNAAQAQIVEVEAKQAAFQAQAHLQAQLQHAQTENAELLEKQERQALIQKRLEADLAKNRQALEVEQHAAQAGLQAQVQLQAQLQQAQTENAELLAKQEQQLQVQKGLEVDLAQIQKICDEEARAKAQLQQHLEQAQQVQIQLQAEISQKAEVQVLFKQQVDELTRVRKFLDSSLKKEIANATRQIQAFTGLENYWRTSELPTGNTENHSWPISSDFALYLVTLLEQNDYDLVIEFGSGVSTVVVAKALAKMAPRRMGKPAVAFASFDHLEQYYQQTQAMLKQAGLDGYVQLHHAPLQDWRAPSGHIYPYYACQEELARLAQQHIPVGLRVLVIVDGPPAATGTHARYPASPLVLQYFAGAHIDFLLDDFIRADEKEVAQQWQEEITAAHIPHTRTERKLEKDACLVQVFSVHNPITT